MGESKRPEAIAHKPGGERPGAVGEALAKIGRPDGDGELSLDASRIFPGDLESR